MPSADNQGLGRPRHASPWASRTVIAAVSVVVALLTLMACSGSPRQGAQIAGTQPPTTSSGDGAEEPDASGGGVDGGDSGSGEVPAVGIPSPTSASPSPDELEQHLAACAQQLDSRQLGQVAYPRFLRVPLGREAMYEASLDIRPGAEQQPAPEAGTQVETVEVRCGVGARLVGLGESVAVDDENEWIYVEFDTPGVFEWAWIVRATKLEDSQVRLELRPAVAVSGGGFVVPGNDDPRAPTVGYESDIDVQAGLVDQADSFASDTWPKIARVAGVIAMALLALVAFYWKFRRAARGEEEDEPAPPHPRRPHRRRGGRRRGRTKSAAEDPARGQSDADQGGRVRVAEADPVGGPDGDPVAGEEHRPVGLDLGVPSDGGDHPSAGSPHTVPTGASGEVSSGTPKITRRVGWVGSG
jgi:hypothetical protein